MVSNKVKKLNYSPQTAFYFWASGGLPLSGEDAIRETNPGSIEVKPVSGQNLQQILAIDLLFAQFDIFNHCHQPLIDGYRHIVLPRLFDDITI